MRFQKVLIKILSNLVEISNGITKLISKTKNNITEKKS